MFGGGAIPAAGSWGTWFAAELIFSFVPRSQSGKLVFAFEERRRGS